MSNSYLYIENTDTQLHSGDIVIIPDYGDLRWIVKQGWYKIGNARKNGWYFLSLSDSSIVEPSSIDLDSVRIDSDCDANAVKPSVANSNSEYNYVVIPGTNVKLYDGDIIRVTKYPKSKWFIHCGWYVFENKQNYGWYLSNIKSGKTLPISVIDLKTCTLLSAKEQGSTYHSGPELNYTRPFTDSDYETLSRTFISLDTIEQRDNLDVNNLPNGRLVRVNNEDGSATYYAWNANQHRWEPVDFAGNIKRVIGTYDNPVILADLNPSVYLVYGQYRISKDDPTTHITFSDILTEVNKVDEETYVKVIDDRTIIDYIVEDDSVVLVSEYATTAYIDSTYAKIEYVDSKFGVLEAQIQELLATLDDRIRVIAREEDRLYSTDIAKSYIDNLFN